MNLQAVLGPFLTLFAGAHGLHRQMRAATARRGDRLALFFPFVMRIHASAETARPGSVRRPSVRGERAPERRAAFIQQGGAAVARQPHKLEVARSNRASASKFRPQAGIVQRAGARAEMQGGYASKCSRERSVAAPGGQKRGALPFTGVTGREIADLVPARGRLAMRDRSRVKTPAPIFAGACA